MTADGTAMPPQASAVPTPLPVRPSAATLARRIVALAAPTTLLALVQSAGQLFETFLAARQGTTALAGWTLVLPFSLLIAQMSAGAMGGGVVSAIARALGAGRADQAAALVLHALLIAVAGGLAFTLVLAGFPHVVFGAIGGPAAAAAAVPYAVALFGVGAVPIWLANTFASILRGGGRHALSARVMLATALAQPPLAWALMEPFGMGLAGAGLSIALCFIVAAAVQGWFVFRGAAGIRPSLRLRPQPALFGQILSVGLTACLMATIANASTILVTARIAAYGPVAVAAYGISARIEFLMVPLAFGVGSALTALVGRAVGAGDWTTARRTAWVGGGLAVLVTGLVGLFVSLFPAATANAFVDDPAVAALAGVALSWIGPALPGFGLGMALYFAAMGAGRMRWPLVAGLARLLIAVGGGWLMADRFGFGLPGQFLAVALGITAFGLINALAVRPGLWAARRS